MAESYKASGPLFDGGAKRAMANYAEELDAELVDEGRRLVVHYLDRFLRHPTGYYVSNVRVEQRGTAHQVTDSGVVYGPWLAGASSRNRSTRFKGYRHWRLAQQDLEKRSGAIAQRIMPRYLRRAS